MDWMFGLADGESKNGKYKYFLPIQPQYIALDHNIRNNYFSRPQYNRVEKEHFILLNIKMKRILSIAFFWIITEKIFVTIEQTAIPDLK